MGGRPVALCIPQSEFGAAQNLDMSTRCGLRGPLILVYGAINTQKEGEIPYSFPSFFSFLHFLIPDPQAVLWHSEQ